MDINTAKQIIEKTGSCKFNTSGVTPFIQMKGMTGLSGIKHCFTTRLGGVSRGIYESLNMGIHLEDDRELVIENYRRLSESVGFDYTRISCPNQVHKDHVLVVREDDAGDGIVRERTHVDIDAQITNVEGIPLIVYAADCVPILLADPVNRAVGSVHSGWKGTALGISAKTVRKMNEEYGSFPENIHAAIGPSIGIGNYEVDDKVIEEIRACPYIKDNMTVSEKGGFITFENAENRPVFYKKENGKYMLNLWEACRQTLISAGLKEENIYLSELCTMEYHDIFFSHRYTKGRRGLNAGVIVLRNIQKHQNL